MNWRWVKTMLLAAVGGGVATVVTHAVDPMKYHFPQDLGSGKMWAPFFSGMGVTFLALLMRSPLAPNEKHKEENGSDK